MKLNFGNPVDARIISLQRKKVAYKICLTKNQRVFKKNSLTYNSLKLTSDHWLNAYFKALNDGALGQRK